MAPVSYMSLLVTLLWLMMATCSRASDDAQDYLEDACSVTRYHDVCIQSLAPFSHVAKDSPSKWARAGISVAIAESKRVARYLATVSRSGNSGGLRGRHRAALSDCRECFEDSLYHLYRSLNVLRNLSSGDFVSQMEDVTTWVSAALTDEDTCVDGFEELKGKPVRFVVDCVSNVTYMTSNALALVNKLGTAGPDCLTNG